jgi:hypothetical protein
VLYGPLSKYEFHMAGSPSKQKVSHYVYAIFQNQVIGRLRINAQLPGAVNAKSGRPSWLIMVSAPGERLEMPISKKGHRGPRFTEGEDWPE